MGLLDDLRHQADSQREVEAADAKRLAKLEAYYTETMQPRMIKAYQFITEFVNHLNYIKHETFAEYPLLPKGECVRLQQQDYKVVIDSSKALKKINFSMTCVLDEPHEFDLFGKEVVLAHAERVERYSFKHERKDRKNSMREIDSAKFTLIGPLPLSVQIFADVANSKIELDLRNFNEPGFTKYNLTAKEFDDDFLDRLAKYIIRQEKTLFGGEEISEQARKQLRDKIVVEKRIRDEEMRDAEERIKAEEEAIKQRSAKEQIKRAVNTKMAKNKDKLKEMFNKLKEQAGFDKSG